MPGGAVQAAQIGEGMETQARMKAERHGALCARCSFFFPGKKKNCERYGDSMTLYAMPVAFCEGFKPMNGGESNDKRK